MFSLKSQIHGVLNAVSWGILFPLGVIIARYLRTFPSADPAWFYLHVSCQVSAYAIGVAGWGTGLKLGSESKGVEYSGHRNIGIAAFCLATLQVSQFLIRETMWKMNEKNDKFSCQEVELEPGVSLVVSCKFLWYLVSCPRLWRKAWIWELEQNNLFRA